MYQKIIIDADMCIKLGCSEKYRFLVDILPLVSQKIYIHSHAYSEVMSPKSAVDQLNELVQHGIVEIVDEKNLCPNDRAVYKMTFKKLSEAMISPNKPKKNKGETCSLAYAKTTGIPIFATDEAGLQPIIDKLLNTGIDDIHCFRIKNIVESAFNGDIDISRKTAKALWRISTGRPDANNIFDKEIWPIDEEK